MKNILLRFFKIWICSIPSIIFWVIAHPLNVALLFIPQLTYWFITAGRDLADDAESFLNWVLNIK
jgi:hypothetical protein